MGIGFMATADTGDTSMWDDVSGTVSASNDTSRTGEYSFRMGMPGVDSILGANIISQSEYYSRVAFYIGSNATFRIKFWDAASGVMHVEVIIESTTRTIEIKRGDGTQLQITSAGVFVTNVWNCLELDVLIDNVAGWVLARLNGVAHAELTFSGDTRNGGADDIDYIQILAPADNYVYIDDVILRDDTWPGVGGIYVMTPIADGAYAADWIASAGNRPDCVDELPSTFTDYIYSDAEVSNIKSSFITSGMPAGTYVSIDNVRVAAKAMLDTAGTGAIWVFGKSSANIQIGAEENLNETDPIWVYTDMPLDISGSVPWVKDAVDAIEVGVETYVAP